MATTAWSKGVLRPLLVLNLMMFVTVLGLAGWSLDRFIDRDSHRRFRGNMLTINLLVFSLIAGAMGLCSVVAGLVHLRAWRGDSLASAVSSALISWAMMTLTFGLACKHISIRSRRPELRALEAFIIILTVTELMYLILLHMGIMSSKYGVGYRSHCNAYGMMDREAQKDSAAPASRPDAA